MKAALVGPAWQVVTHFPLFTQVSEAAMAAVPELTSEMMAYYRSVGRLRPVTGAGSPSISKVLPVHGGQICPPNRTFPWQTEFQVYLV